MDLERLWRDTLVASAAELWKIDLLHPRFAPLIEPPSDFRFGDLASGVAMRLARDLKKPPRKIAEELVAKLGDVPGASRIDVAGAGFINFIAGKAALASAVDAARREGPSYGRSDVRRGCRVLVEHTSANPTGPLHIAHGRQAAIGDSLARVLRHAGFTVGTEFYVNDTGRQIENLGKSILWRRYELQGTPFRREIRGVDDEGRPAAWLAAEINGARFEIEERNLYRGDYIIELAKRVPEPVTLGACGRFGRDVLLAEIRRDLEDFRVAFDRWSSQEALERGGAVADLVEKLKARGLTFEKDGAVWLLSRDYGDTDDKVLVKKDGQYTYRTPDIAYHCDKFGRGWDRLVDLWGPDHHAHVLGMRVALKMLGLLKEPDVMAGKEVSGTLVPSTPAENFQVLIVQHCRLLKDGQEVKMGKRLASYVTLRELMEEVGVDAARYFFVMRKTDSPLDFDMTLALRQEADNPVYYVQYAHARIASVLRKAVDKGLLRPSDFKEGVYAGPFEADALGAEETLLIRHMSGLRRTVDRAAQALDPSLVCAYLYSLAAAYQFYQTAGKKDPSKRILVDDERVRRMRLASVSAVKAALKTAMGLIGVEAPERMESVAAEPEAES
ncbi:MAG: arginine--tRNA ligase [Planctomycetes bacterium]|nr:arginine--tRNA ligase [Planctomycetota bacterium]